MGEHTTGPSESNHGFDNDEPDDEATALAEKFWAEGQRRGWSEEQIQEAATRFIAQGPSSGNRAQRRKRRS